MQLKMEWFLRFVTRHWKRFPPHRWYGNTFIRIDYFVHAHDVLLEVVTAAIKAYIECYSYAFSNECLKTALLKGRKAFPNAPLEAHGFRLKLLSEAVTTLCHAEVGHPPLLPES